MSCMSPQNLNRPQPFGQYPQQILLLKRNAALGRAEAGARQMQQNRASAPTHDRRIIPAQHTNHIVNRISAPKFFMPRRMRQADLRIVIGVRRIIAPAIIGRDGCNKHGPAWRCQTIRAIQHATQRQ